MRIIVFIISILLISSVASADNKIQKENLPVFSNQDLNKYQKTDKKTNNALPEKSPVQPEDDNSNKINNPVNGDTGNIAGFLKEKWKLYAELLRKGDTKKALKHICPDARPQFERMFKEFGPNIKLIAATQTDFKFLYVIENTAKCALATNERGSLHSYEVTFARDQSNNWCIMQY